MEACTGDRDITAASLSPHSTSFPSRWWLLWGPEGSERRKKEFRDMNSLSLLLLLCSGFGLSLYGRGTIAGSFSCEYFNGSLGDSLLDLLSKVLLGQASPLPAGYRVVHPPVESHHHFR